jgi:hypothetical protein
MSAKMAKSDPNTRNGQVAWASIWSTVWTVNTG